VDPTARRPYLFHLALIAVDRQADPTLPALAQSELLEYRLVGLKQGDEGHLEECPVEHLLLLKGGQGVPPAALRFAVTAGQSRELARTYATEQAAWPLVSQRRRALADTLAEREEFLRRGYDYQEADLAAARARLTQKATAGDARAKGELTRIKERQRRLWAQREEALRLLRREPELIAPGEVTFLAHALVVPSSDPEDGKRHDEAVEAVAVKIAWAYEEAAGASVKDVSTPELARKAGLPEHPGFDLLSLHSERGERAIEVKGRAGTGDVELTENEWARACNHRDRYWLYVIYDCATPHPRLLRVQDPFAKLIVRAKGGVVIEPPEVLGAADV
jgi:hypothetical protein